jgi:hypothetical protein
MLGSAAGVRSIGGAADRATKSFAVAVLARSHSRRLPLEDLGYRASFGYAE